MLAERLRGRGADVRVWEPDAASIAGHPMVPEGFTFEGRPQLTARFRGTGGGRSLLLNGHIDVIAQSPRRLAPPSVRGSRGRRRRSRPRLVRHEGRGCLDGVCRRDAGATGGQARGRPDREHRQRGGVDRSGRPRDGPHDPGRRGDRARAERARTSGSPAGAACFPRSRWRVAPDTPASRHARQRKAAP